MVNDVQKSECEDCHGLGYCWEDALEGDYSKPDTRTWACEKCAAADDDMGHTALELEQWLS